MSQWVTELMNQWTRYNAPDFRDSAVPPGAQCAGASFWREETSFRRIAKFREVHEPAAEAQGRRTDGEGDSKKSRNEGRTHDVVDNKGPVLGTHDVYENKGTYLGKATMFMKTMELFESGGSAQGNGRDERQDGDDAYRLLPIAYCFMWVNFCSLSNAHSACSRTKASSCSRTVLSSQGTN
jgi:hypothetical protein